MGWGPLLIENNTNVENITKCCPSLNKFSFLFSYYVQFATMEMLITAVVDKLPQHLKKWKPLVTFGACFIGFLGGILMVTKVRKLYVTDC